MAIVGDDVWYYFLDSKLLLARMCRFVCTGAVFDSRRYCGVRGYSVYSGEDMVMSEDFMFWVQLILVVSCVATILIVGVAVIVAGLRD